MKDVTGAGRTVLRDFENAKMEDISDCRATARRRMVIQMARRDLGHQIGL